MHRPVLFLLAALCSLPAPRAGAAPFGFTAALDTVWSAGDTRYLMELLGDPGVSSELIFPLDTWLEGARLRCKPPVRGRRFWSVELAFHTNLLDPLGLMQDYDWWMYPNIPKVPFSYTESAAAMRWYQASAEAQIAWVSGGWGSLALAFGYRFQFIEQQITGYTGWQYDDRNPPDGQPELYEIAGSDPALDYRVVYHTATAGLALTLTPALGITLSAEAGLALPYVSDRDDHLLRCKLSTASGFGYGGYAGLEARYTWTHSNPRLRPFLALSGSVLGLRARTLQTQTWYGNDPGYSGDETGTSLYGIDHQISTRQYRAAFVSGLEF